MAWVLARGPYTWEQLLEIIKQLGLDIPQMAASLGGPEDSGIDEAWQWLQEHSDPTEAEGYIRYHYKDIPEPSEHRDPETMSPEEQFRAAQEFILKSTEGSRQPDALDLTSLTEKKAYEAIMRRRENLQAIANLPANPQGTPTTDAEYYLGVSMTQMRNQVVARDLLWGGHEYSNTPMSAAQRLWAHWGNLPYKVIGSKVAQSAGA